MIDPDPTEPTFRSNAVTLWTAQDSLWRPIRFRTELARSDTAIKNFTTQFICPISRLATLDILMINFFLRVFQQHTEQTRASEIVRERLSVAGLPS
jgi:hypothetical protein